MRFQKTNTFLYVLSALYILFCGYMIYTDQAYLSLASLSLVLVVAALFYTEQVFLFIAFCTPLSINIESYTDSFGLFIPTEPLLFGIMILVILVYLKNSQKFTFIFKSPIVWALGFYLLWVAFTSITSTHPLASAKFLVARLWFIVPIFLYGTLIFLQRKNIRIFLWLFCIGMLLAMTYTLVVHATYRFGEKESHWVMFPFFKDHTIYGAIVALVVPLLFGIYFSKKHSPLVQFLLIGFIALNLLALYFSYTRAAQLSVVAALGVLVAIRMRIKFSYIASTVLVATLFLWFSWDSIQLELSRNKQEHTTENFAERIQSATNVTTDASNLERINRWTSAIDMFKERPVFGFGPGTYAFEYASFQRPENLTIISTNFGNMGNAHSEYLGPLAEMGLVGMLSMILIVVAIFYKGITLYYKWPAEDQEMKTLILALILALTTYFVHAFLNNFLDTDKAAVPIWSFCAMFIALEYQLKNKNSHIASSEIPVEGEQDSINQ